MLRTTLSYQELLGVRCTKTMRLIVLLLIACTVLAGVLALYTAYGQRVIEGEYPPLGSFIEAGGLRLHYVDTSANGATGSPPVVLIHGASTNLRDFTTGLQRELAPTLRVLAFDRPGYGYSERPPGPWPDPARQARIIRDALDSLGIDRPLLVGHSWSGSVVLAHLLNHPRHAAGGVLLAGGSHPWEGGVAWTNKLATIPVLGAAE